MLEQPADTRSPDPSVSTVVTVPTCLAPRLSGQQEDVDVGGVGEEMRV
jgi:hypothetical protein